jgi:hypothetical protein
MNENALPLIVCPECGEVASIEWFSTIDQRLYLKTRCVRRRPFLLPGDQVSCYRVEGIQRLEDERRGRRAAPGAW